MKKIFLIVYIGLALSCATNHHFNESKTILGKVGGLLETQIKENSDTINCYLSGTLIDLVTKDSIGSAILIISKEKRSIKLNSRFDGGFFTNKLNEGFYHISISSLGYYSIMIDSVHLAKGKNTFIKIGLVPKST